ncbi:MAG TPA: zinc-binding dehydrogenase [Ardenticatenaceae bacterium]|jgi:NADPH:quinone reductase-like Zn-dependent oxidoreductase
MQAMVYTQTGGPEVIQPMEVPTPTPGRGEVRVRVVASALNHLDLWARRGLPGIPPGFPHVGGCDIAGVVDVVGADVAGWQAGERVVINPTFSCGVCEWCQRGEDPLCDQFAIIGEHRWGGFAEFIVVPARNLERVPDGFSLIEAAAVPLVYATAWRMLVTRARIRPGETVLVIGAGGGVNSAAIQIAALTGCRVWATTSSAEKADAARQLGAEFVVNYVEDEAWSRAIYRQSGKRGVDVVVDNVGAATWTSSLRSLAKGGRLVTVGATTGPIGETDIRLIFWRQLQVIGSTMSNRAEFAEVMRLVWQGKLRPVIDRVIPLAELRAGHEALEAGNQFGKIVVRVGEE